MQIIVGTMKLSAPKISRHAILESMPAQALKWCFSLSHCSRETLIKSNSPRSNEHTRAAEFDTLRFNQRIPRKMTMNIAVMTKSSPSVLNVMSSPRSPPMVAPPTQ